MGCVCRQKKKIYTMWFTSYFGTLNSMYTLRANQIVAFCNLSAEYLKLRLPELSGWNRFRSVRVSAEAFSQRSRGERCKMPASCPLWWRCAALCRVDSGLWRSFLCGTRRIPERVSPEILPTGPGGRPQGQRTETKVYRVTREAAWPTLQPPEYEQS